MQIHKALLSHWVTVLAWEAITKYSGLDGLQQKYISSESLTLLFHFCEGTPQGLQTATIYCISQSLLKERLTLFFFFLVSNFNRLGFHL